VRNGVKLFNDAMPSNSFFQTYTVWWISFCLVAAAILWQERIRVAANWRAYVRFLCVPWKLATFLPAFLFVGFGGHFTDDETWDLVTGIGMSILTFTTAPWAIGILYKCLSGKKHWKYLMVAVALTFFSCSWFYDGYLFLRDGHYTSRWLGNLILSPMVYVAAGLMWNLEAFGYGGCRLSFFRDNWPQPPDDKRFKPVVVASIPFIVIATCLLVEFVHWHW
jgi:hypothetical protein